MRPNQSTALHASLLSLTMSDGELSDDDALTFHTNAVEAEDMNAGEAAKGEPAALLQRRLPRRRLSVIPSIAAASPPRRL
jgi:hypothetical protein